MTDLALAALSAAQVAVSAGRDAAEKAFRASAVPFTPSRPCFRCDGKGVTATACSEGMCRVCFGSGSAVKGEVTAFLAAQEERQLVALRARFVASRAALALLDGHEFERQHGHTVKRQHGHTVKRMREEFARLVEAGQESRRKLEALRARA